MKIFFFVVLLCNIVFFIWGVNSRPINTSEIIINSDKKQIQLLSEMPEREIKVASLLPNKQVELNEPEEESVINKLPANDSIITSDEIKPIKQQAINVSPEPEVEQITKTIEASVELKHSIPKVNVKLNKQAESVVSDNQLVEEKKIIESVSAEAEVLGFCFQIGPFIDKNKIVSWSKLNKIDKDSFTFINKDIEVLSSYLVYYPAADTFQQSIKDAQMLKNKGISDYWLFRNGNLKGVVSLGLFVKKNRAYRLQQKYLKVGVNVNIMPRYKSKLAWYAKVLSDQELLKDNLTLLETQSVSTCED